MNIRAHTPNYFSGIEPKQMEFTTLQELLNIKWIQRYSSFTFDNIPFWRYSQSKYRDEWLLMVEWKVNNEHKWLVIGYISDDIGLPEFKAS